LLKKINVYALKFSIFDNYEQNLGNLDENLAEIGISSPGIESRREKGSGIDIITIVINDK
jgi:hypothetical protein